MPRRFITMETITWNEYFGAWLQMHVLSDNKWIYLDKIIWLGWNRLTRYFGEWLFAQFMIERKILLKIHMITSIFEKHILFLFSSNSICSDDHNRISNWVEWTEIVALSWMLKLGWLRRKIRKIRFSMIIIIVTVPGFRTTSENENIYIKSSPLKLLRYDIEFHCRLMFDCDFGCDSTSQRSVVATA